MGIEQRPDAKAGQTDEVVRTRDDYGHVYHFFPTARALGWWCPRFGTIETRNGCAGRFPSFSSAAVVEGDAVVRRRSSGTVAQVLVIACTRLGQKFVRRENSPFRFASSCEISLISAHTGRMFRVLQNLNSDTNRPIAKNKRKSSAERRRRRLATAAAIEEHRAGAARCTRGTRGGRGGGLLLLRRRRIQHKDDESNHVGRSVG